jgi:hypothetical protein
MKLSSSSTFRAHIIPRVPAWGEWQPAHGPSLFVDASPGAGSEPLARRESWGVPPVAFFSSWQPKHRKFVPQYGSLRKFPSDFEADASAWFDNLGKVSRWTS